MEKEYHRFLFTFVQIPYISDGMIDGFLNLLDFNEIGIENECKHDSEALTVQLTEGK